MPKGIAERVPWGKVLLAGGAVLGGLFLYSKVRQGLGNGLPSVGDLFSDIVGGTTGAVAEGLGGAAGGVLKGIFQFPLAVGEAVGARQWGEKAFDVFLTPYIDESDYVANLQWTGQPPATPIDPAGFVQHQLATRLVQPEATLGGSSKEFLIEAPWREDPTIFAGLGPIQGYPTAEAYLEAQRAKFAGAGFIPGG